MVISAVLAIATFLMAAKSFETPVRQDVILEIRCPIITSLLFATLQEGKLFLVLGHLRPKFLLAGNPYNRTI